MIIKEIKEKNEWENFLLGCREKTFLDSWNWGEFNMRTGNKIWRWGMYANEELAGIALIIKIVARRGTFLFVPHGPNIKPQTTNLKFQILELLLKELRKVAEEEKVSFIRIAPIWERNEENVQIFQGLGFREAPIHMHPEVSWELDISGPEEEILAGMRKTTRYLIRQGLKNPDIKICQGKDINDLEVFNGLYKATAGRHHFAPFSLNYLKNELLAFSPNDQISIFLGKHKSKILSGAMIIFWQNIAFYHQGASLSSRIPVSYLLQWEAVKEAKRRNCKAYNFWGIASATGNHKSKIENLEKHPWRGLTLFKIGFGGYKKEYIKTQDLVLSKKYWLNYFIEKLRKKRRGF